VKADLDPSTSGLTDTEREFREVVRRFMAKEVEPLVDELEADPGRHFDKLFPAMGGLGLLGSFFPVQYGGGGGSLITRAIVAEETARVNAGLDASMFADIALFGRAVLNFGNEAQKHRYLTPVIEGTRLGSMGITEPGGGSNALAPKTKARQVGDRWILNGSKTFITNAPIADYFAILARTSGQDRSSAGGTWFLIERGTPGLETGPAFDKMGWRSSPTGEVFLSDVELGPEQVLGEPEQGFRYLFESLDTERVLVGASCIGIARACLEESIRYGCEREVFGQRIADYQLIQEKIADMAVGIQLTRAQMYSLLARIEAGEKVTQEAAILKLYATQMAARAASEAVQVHGGVGILNVSKVSRCYRDAKIHEIGAGSNEILKQLIAKRAIASYLEQR
jgi:alkylation response protein AidB-like acyl-CoA dehydrogenase